MIQANDSSTNLEEGKQSVEKYFEQNYKYCQPQHILINSIKQKTYFTACNMEKLGYILVLLVMSELTAGLPSWLRASQVAQ